METLQKGCDFEQSSSFARSNTATEIAPATHFQGSNFSGRLHFPEMPEGKHVMGAVVLLSLSNLGVSLCHRLSSNLKNFDTQGLDEDLPINSKKCALATHYSHYWQSGIPNNFIVSSPPSKQQVSDGIQRLVGFPCSIKH